MRGVVRSDGIERRRPWSFRRWNPPSRGGSPCAIMGGHEQLRGLLAGDIFTEGNRNLRIRTEMAAKHGSLCATGSDKPTQNSMIDVTQTKTLLSHFFFGKGGDCKGKTGVSHFHLPV